MSTNPLGSQLKLASREDRLAQEIVQMLSTIRRASEGKFLEATALLSRARVPVRESRLRVADLPTLQAGHLLLTGFVDEALRTRSLTVPSRVRGPLDVAGMDGGLTAASTELFTLEGADGAVYDAFVSHGTTSDSLFGAFGSGDLGGTTTNFAQIQAGDAVQPIVSLQTNRTALARCTQAAAFNVFPCTIDSTGSVAVGAAIGGLTGVGTDRPVTRDYTDGRYLWCITQDTVGTQIRLHKLNLSDGTEEGYETITATAAGVGPVAVFAFGDDAVVVVEDSGGVLRANYITIADGAGAGAGVAATAGTALQTPGGDELENPLVSAPFDDVGGLPSGLRLFLDPETIPSSEPQQRIDIYPAEGAAGNVQTSILGLNGFRTGGDVGVSGSGRNIVAIDDAADDIAVLYDVVNGEQLAVQDLGKFVAAIDRVAPVSVNDQILLNATYATVEQILEVSIE